MMQTKRVFNNKEVKDFDDKERVKIANISFAYANKEIIKGLFNRGDMLKVGQIEPGVCGLLAQGVAKVETKMNGKIELDKDYNKFIKPVTAFVTFKYQNGMERCLKSFESEKNFIGYPVFKKDENGKNDIISILLF